MQRKGDGEELRDYIHVKDAAQACVDLLDDIYRNQYIIISGSQTIKVKELLKMINEMMENNIDIEYQDEHMAGHYEVTPYTFRPRMAKKYTSSMSVDLGQGLLDTIYDVYKQLKRSDDEQPIITLPE
jgi:UDP-glucose 4-epimerase